VSCSFTSSVSGRLEGDLAGVELRDGPGVIAGVQDSEGRLLSASVTSAGAATKEPTRTAALSDRAQELLDESGTVLATGAIAEELGVKNDGTLARALKQLAAAETARQPGRGQWITVSS
jgi:hypothetical protein